MCGALGGESGVENVHLVCLYGTATLSSSRFGQRPLGNMARRYVVERIENVLLVTGEIFVSRGDRK